MLRTLRQIQRSPLYSRGWRSTSSFKFLELENTESQYSIIKMNRKPVNSFSLEYINEFIEALDQVEKRPESRGLVITSNLKVFSAGLDLTEMYNPEQDPGRQERLTTFWTAFQELSLRLYSTPLVTVAAINGASPAGGCAISLNCDSRIMVDGKHTIGLNETQLGLMAPYWLGKAFQAVVGYRQAEMLLMTGRLLNPQEALKIGLIDAVVAPEELMAAVDAEMKQFLAIPEIGRVKTKQLMRRDYVADFIEKREEDLQGFTDAVNNPILQKTLGMYFKALQQKQKK